MISRPLTVVFAALEALLVVAIGIAIPLLPLTVLWAVQFGFGADWAAFWRASVDIWLIGHGVAVTFVLDPSVAAALGLPGAEVPFTVDVAALGFALLTVLLGVRAGRRISETRYRGLGALVAAGTFAVASVAITATALHPLARPSLVQAAFLPVLFFVAGLAIGVQLTLRDLGQRRRSPLDALPATPRELVATALRGGAAAAALLVLLASLATAASIAVSYAGIITLYESLHTEVLGGVALTLAQLAFLPTLVVWAVSWLVGPGFALGTGSLVSPLGTALGPLPAIPVLGALPTGQSAFGFVGLLAPVVAGFLVGAVLGPGIRRRLEGPLVIAAPLLAGAIAGLIVGVLCAFASGGLGPGRLADVGPNPWQVGILAAIEIGVAATIGVLASGRLPGRAGR
ncbi:cell division protein PerM [Schumannella luteola]